MSFSKILSKAISMLKKQSEYVLIQRKNGEKIATKPNQTYLFDIQAAVIAGRFSQLILELFTDRGYMVEGGVIVCPASIKVLEIETVLPDNKMGVIPILNIPDIKADLDLRALIVNAPIEFITELPTQPGKGR